MSCQTFEDVREGNRKRADSRYASVSLSEFEL